MQQSSKERELEERLCTSYYCSLCGTLALKLGVAKKLDALPTRGSDSSRVR